jgi:hypothetical protein
MGDYSTERFEGSRFILDDVEFTDINVPDLQGNARFPDRGDIELETRVSAENAEMIAEMDKIVGAVSLVDFDIRVNRVLFSFPDEPIDLTVE